MTEKQGSGSSQYSAKFLYKSYLSPISLQVDTKKLPKIAKAYCVLDVFVYDCSDDCKSSVFYENTNDPAVAAHVLQFSLKPNELVEKNITKPLARGELTSVVLFSEDKSYPDLFSTN